MKIREVMTENVQVLHPGATLCEAARRMKELDVGVMPVCEEDHLVGMVTDRDIVVRALAHETDPRTEIVANVMSSPVRFCFEDHSVEEAANVMEKNQVRRLAVMSREKRLIGIVALGDLATKKDHRHSRISEEILEAVSEAPKEITGDGQVQGAA